MTKCKLAKSAINYYRTGQYIVKQELYIKLAETEYNALCSYDTYYRRTPKRDLEYGIRFAFRKNIEGRRLPSNMYMRKYIE